MVRAGARRQGYGWLLSRDPLRAMYRPMATFCHVGFGDTSALKDDRPTVASEANGGTRPQPIPGDPSASGRGRLPTGCRSTSGSPPLPGADLTRPAAGVRAGQQATLRKPRRPHAACSSARLAPRGEIIYASLYLSWLAPGRMVTEPGIGVGCIPSRRWVRPVWRRPAPGVRTAAARARCEPARTTSLLARVIAV